MKLYAETEQYKLYEGNMLDMLDVIEENSIDSIVTDPPYELGFMGKSWDKSGIAFQKETWEKCLRVLKPGGYLLSFGAPRNFHRVACAIEDAGFEIRDTIMYLFGSGFPKSLNIGKAVEAKLTTGSANTQEFKNLDGDKQIACGWGINNMHFVQDDRPSNYDDDKHEYTTSVNYTTEEGKRWNGWGSALKPAFEPIIVARKPCEGTTTDNVIEYGVGGINIDECRIQTDDTLTHGGPLRTNSGDDRFGKSLGMFQDGTENTFVQNPNGRFPSNVILSYDETNEQEVCGGFPNSGSGNGGEPYNYAGREYNNKDTSMFNGDKPQAPSNYNDNGSAARYFYNAKMSNRDVDGSIVETSDNDNTNQSGRFPSNVILSYDESDFDEVCGGMPIDSGYTPHRLYSNIDKYDGYGSITYRKGELVGYGDSGSAARYFYCAKASRRDRDDGLPENVHSDHPTVKPTSLMSYLVRLVTPKNGTILDPFNGSGSTGKAVIFENRDRNAGYKYIGIDLSEHYLDISKQRIEYACVADLTKDDNGNVIIKKKKEEDKPKFKQFNLFG